MFRLKTAIETKYRWTKIFLLKFNN